jgi:glycosyltransferase involved in cell wall biosynthesis
MRVLQLISSGGFYGAENMLINLAQSLEGLGCKNVVGVFDNAHHPNTEVGDHARRLGLPVETIACRGKIDWGTVRAIRNSVRNHRIDLVHSHGYKTNLYGYAAVRPLGTPILATCHNWTHETVPLRLYALLDRMVLRKFPHVVAVSEAVGQSLRGSGIRQERITTIHNGVSLNGVNLPCSGAASSLFARELDKGARLVVGTVGRLVPQKGLEHFLRAAGELLSRFPQTLFVLVGEGPGRERLEILAGALGTEGKVIFTGHRSDLASVYAAMDIFVLPSLNEGMPMTILEALAARRPVVATRVGGIPRLILPEQTGLLVEPGDTVGLRDAIARLLADPQLRQRLGENGYDCVRRNFSAQAMARNYLALYRRLLRQAA